MNKEKKPCSPKESLEKSLQEMKRMREGKKDKTTWDQYRKGEKLRRLTSKKNRGRKKSFGDLLIPKNPPFF